MSNRAKRPATGPASHNGQTNKHHLSVEAKKLAQRNHTGKYATARDIQTRILAIRAERAFKYGLNG